MSTLLLNIDLVVIKVESVLINVQTNYHIYFSLRFSACSQSLGYIVSVIGLYVPGSQESLLK